MYCDVILEHKEDHNETSARFAWGMQTLGASGILLRGGHWIFQDPSENVLQRKKVSVCQII